MGVDLSWSAGKSAKPAAQPSASTAKVNLNSISLGTSVGVDVGSRSNGIGVGVGLEGLVLVEVGCASVGFAFGDVGRGSSVAAGS